MVYRFGYLLVGRTLRLEVELLEHLFECRLLILLVGYDEVLRVAQAVYILA